MNIGAKNDFNGIRNAGKVRRFGLLAACLLLALLLALAGLACAEPATEEPNDYPVLELNTDTDVIIREGGETKWFAFTPDKPGIYRFEATGDYDNRAAVYADPAGEPLAENDDRLKVDSNTDESEKANFRLEAALEKDKTYYFAARMCYDDAVGDFTVKISWLRKAIKDAEILQDPRLVYYQGYDTVNNIRGNGACVKFTYDDDSTEIRNCAYYYYYDGSSDINVTHNANTEYNYDTSKNFLRTGKFKLTLSYKEWSKSYDAEVISEERIPVLTAGESETIGISEGHWFRYTAPTDGYYLFQAKRRYSSSSSSLMMSVYNAQGNQLSAVYTGNSSYYDTNGWVYRLSANETCLINFGRNSGFSYNSNEDNRADFTVGIATEMTDTFTEGEGFLIRKYVPEENGIHFFEIGLSDSIYYRPYMVDDEGNSVSLFTESSTSADYPENYRNSYRRYGTEALEAGKTYHLFVGTYCNWTARTYPAGETIQKVELAEDVEQKGTLASGKTIQFFYTIDEDAYYHVHQVDSNYWLRPEFSSDYSPEVLSGNHYGTDVAGTKHYYIDHVFWGRSGNTVRFSASNTAGDGSERNYHLIVEKLPAITQLTVSKQPDNNTFLRTDYVNISDLTGMELKAVYADGMEETVYVNGSDNYATRTGLQLNDVRAERDDYGRRLIAGEQDATITYLGAATTVVINVVGEEFADDLPLLTEGVELAGTFPNKDSSWIQFLFKPTKTGTYKLTGTISNPLSLYLYNSKGEKIPNKGYNYTWYSNGEYSISWYLQAGETYLLEGMNEYYWYSGEEDIQYALTVSLVKEQAETEISLDSPQSVTIEDGIPVWFTFTPTETARYRFYSTDCAYNPNGAIYQGGVQLASDTYGGYNNNFSMTCLLKAGVTYWLRVDSYNNEDSCFAVLIKAPVVTALEITSLPYRTNVYFPYDYSSYNRSQNGISFEGLTITAQLDGQREETLDYYDTSSETGESMKYWIVDPVIDEEKNYLLPGTYDAVVSYGGLEKTFQIIVRGEKDISAIVPDTDVTTGEWEIQGNMYWTLTVPENGYYSVTALKASSEYYSNSYLYEKGNTDYLSIASSTYKTVIIEDVSYSGDEDVYYLKKGTEYILQLPSEYSSDRTSYRVQVTGMRKTLAINREEEVEADKDRSDAFLLNIEESGFYRYEYEETSNSENAIPYLSHSMKAAGNQQFVDYSGGSDSASAEIGGSTVYTRKGNRFYYLSRGQYILNNRVSSDYSSTSQNFTYTHKISRIYPTSWPVSDTTAFDLARNDAFVIAVPEGADGAYTFQIESATENGSNGRAYLYDSESSSSLAYSYISSKYDNELKKYVYQGAIGTTLEGGKQYLLRLTTYGNNSNYTVKAQNRLQVVSATIKQMPKQRYYYKLENLTATTSLSNGIQLSVTYNDGETETLYGDSSSGSSKTGMKMALALPEDAIFDEAGNLLPGMYDAQLTYMDMEPLTVPIEVATVADMPRLYLDANGQGTYSGPVEDLSTGYGFIRFVADEDGFYNLTLSVDTSNYRYSDISYSSLYNSAYKAVSITNPTYDNTENRYLANGSVYVRKGQACYIRYHYYGSVNSDGQFTLTVERATDLQIVPLKLNTPQPIESGSGTQWYSFTPEVTATYYLNTREHDNYSYSDSIALYASPDASSALSSGYSWYANGNDTQIRYEMTAGKTYYYRVANPNCNFQLILVKEASPVSLELLTEGDIFCSTIEANVNKSFADLLFKVTYNDGTTEELTFGYNHTDTRSYSMMGTQIKVSPPSWEKNEDGTIKQDQVKTVRFILGNATTDVTVIPRSIENLEELKGTITVSVPAHESVYYRFMAADTGYYRFDGSTAAQTPVLTLYNQYMAEEKDLFNNQLQKNDGWHVVRVYHLEAKSSEDADDILYCLRLTNNSSQLVDITFTAEQLSPVSSITVDPESLPQTNYYLGIDRQFTDDGLAALVTYEDDTTETIIITDGEGISESTGLKMQTSLSRNNIVRTLSTETQTVYLTYMNGEGSYPITVMDSSTIQALKAGQRSGTATLASAQDSAYAKFTPEESGFYTFNMATEDADLSAKIDAVKNSSYTDLTLAVTSRTGDEATVYLLAGKSYYLKGHLENNERRSGGAYTALVTRITDLRDGVQQGETSDYALYQFTTTDSAYYQFTLDASTYVGTEVYESGMSPVTLTTGYKLYDDGYRLRRYYAAKLQASSSYLIVVRSQTTETNSYAIHAGKKPNIKSVSITSLPDKTVFYAFYDKMADVDVNGLELTITYEDGETETLAYGQRSTWGVSMTLDSSAIKADKNGCLLEGEYTVTAAYLDQKDSYKVKVNKLDPTTLVTLAEDTSVTLNAATDESLFFAIDAKADHTYRLYSRNADEVLRATLYKADGTLVKSDVGDPDFSLESALEAGTTYVIRIQAANAGRAFTGTMRLHDNANSIEVTGISILRDEKPVNTVYMSTVGQTVQLTALVEPEEAKNKKYSWSSKDETIATVTEDGLVTLTGKGNTSITVTTEDGGYTASCAVVFDDTLPTITSYVPASKSTIGPDYRKLNVLVHDDSGIHGIVFRTRKLGTETWDREPWLNPVEELQQDVKAQYDLKLKAADVYLYADGDTIEVEMTPVDRGGNSGEAVTATYTVDLQAPVVSDLAGTYNAETLNVDLDWTVGTEPIKDTDSFAVFRKGSTEEDTAWKRVSVVNGYGDVAEYTWTDTTVENKDASYDYYLIAYDKYGNQEKSNIVTVTTQFLDQKPEVALSVPSMVKTGEAFTVNLTGTKDDVQIANVTVSYGDGTSDTGDEDNLVFTHTYTLSGANSETKTLTVTVEDSIGQETTETRELTVVNANQAGVLEVTVVDTDGIPVKDAPVYFNLGEDDEEIQNTDATGKVIFIGAGQTGDNDRAGFHKVGVLKKNYLPEMQTIILSNGETSQLNFVIEEQPIVEGKLEARRMNLDEINEAAAKHYIDLDDPESYHTMVYNVTLEYETIHFNVCGDHVFDVQAPDGYYPCVLEENVVLVMKIPVAAQILKEFYTVKLYIVNNASSEFKLLDGQVKLSVDPEKGMTILETRNPALVNLDPIPGKTTKEVEWILRGDKSGEYEISADFSATLSEFNKPVTAHFEGEKKLEVRGVDDLKIVMEVPDELYNGEFFYRLSMSNIADVDDENTIIYMPQLRGEGELLRTTWTKQDGETVDIKSNELPQSLKKDEGIQRYYRIKDVVPSEFKDRVFYFRNAMVKEVTELGVPLEVKVVSGDELKKLAEECLKYIALPVTKAEIIVPENLEYGYQAAEATITVNATPADNAEYDLEYYWYDTDHRELKSGKEATFTPPEGLEPGTYHYHCIVRAIRKDNDNKAETNYLDADLIVQPRTAELSWSSPEDENLIYNGQEKEVTATIGNKVGEDEVTVELENAVAKDAGKHVVKAKKLLGNAAAKYALPSEPAEGSEDPNPREYTFTITPKPVKLAWTEDEKLEYDGTAKGVTATVTELVEGDECQVTLEQGTAVKAGTYTATATELSNANYCLPEDAEKITRSYTIEKLTAELAWENADNLVYSGEAQQVKAIVANAVTIGEKKDEVSVTVTGGNEINANTEENPSYTATATELTGADADNYKLPDEPEAGSEKPNPRKRLYSIAPKAVTLKWTEPESMVYDGKEKSVTATAEGFVKEDQCVVTVENGTAVNADTYTATATGLSNTNYCLPEDPTHSYTIERLTAELAWQNNEGLVYDGQAKDVKASVTNLVVIGEKTDEVQVMVAGGTETNAGDYTATATGLTGAAAANYKLPETTTLSYKVAPKSVNVVFAGAEERTYDGTASNITANVEEGGLVGEDSATVTVSGGTEKNAGTYTASATAISNSNYILGGTLTQSYTIKQLTAKLSWSGDQSLVYDGTAKAVTATVGNAIKDDTVTVTVTDGDKTNAGTYTAKATALSNPNYALPETVTHEYVIEQLEAVLTWKNHENLVYDGQKKNVIAEVSNAVTVGENTDEVNVTVTGGDEKDANTAEKATYTAQATGLTGSAAANYKLPAASTKSYVIAPKEVTVSLKDTEVPVYDGTEKTAAIMLNGILEGDDVAIGTTEGLSAKNAGEHIVTVMTLEGSKAANYKLAENANVTYTIAPRTAELSWQNTENLQEDGRKKNVTAIVTNIVEGDTVNVTVTGGDAAEPGTYTAKVEALDNKNYVLPTENLEKNYTIAPIPEVESVREMIKALSANASLKDREKVTAAREALNALKEEQKALLSPELIQKLELAEQQLQAAEKQLEEDKTAFATAKETSIKAAAAKALADDSATSKQLITAAQTQIEALEYDGDKTLDENQAVLDTILTKLDDDLTVQRATDKLESNKQVFATAKASKSAAVAARALADDSAASQQLIAAAKAQIDALVYDESKTPEENQAIIDAILAKLDSDLATQRAADAVPVLQPGTYEYENGVYDVKASGEATYVKPVKPAATIKVADELPASVAGVSVKVTEIKDKAFTAKAIKKKMKTLNIGKNVRIIGKNAAAGCTSLKTVKGGAGVTTIKDGAFSGCTAMTKFTFGKNVTSIGKKAFAKDKKLKTLKFQGTGKLKVGSGAFSEISNDAKTSVPKKVEKAYIDALRKKGKMPGKINNK